LSWGAPGTGYVYDVELYDLYGKVLYFMASTATTSVNVPAGILQPQTLYLLYVKTSDPNNPGNSTLTTESAMYTGSQPMPAFSNANITEQYPYGGRTQYVDNAIFEIPGVMPWEIVSFTIKNDSDVVIQQIDNVWPALKYSLDHPAIYVYSSLNTTNLPDGNYKFEAIIDRAGSPAITSSTFAFIHHDVPPVDYTTLSYGNDYYFDTATPTFMWAGIAGTYYRLQIFDTNGKVEVYRGDWITGNTSYSAAVPAGKLLRGASYYWTVQSSDYNGSYFSTYNYALIGNESDYKDMNRFTILNPSVSGLITNELGAIEPGVLVEALVAGVVIDSTLTGIDGILYHSGIRSRL
jgi:hypothetical protein